MTEMPPTPPRLAQRLLEALLPRGDRSDTVRGDLLEEFRSRANRSGRAGRRWYWRHAIAVLVRIGIRKDPTKGHSEPGRAGLIDSLLADARTAARALTKAPGFTTASVLTLALGIGAATAVFSVVEAVLVRPLPFGDPSHVMWMTETSVHGGQQISIAWPDYVDWRARLHAYSQMAAVQPQTFNLTGSSAAERIEGRRVTWTFLQTLGVRPALGRDFVPADDRIGATPVALISDAFWRTHFVSNPDVLGQQLDINGVPTTVIGVLPSGFRYNPLTNDSVYVSLGAYADRDGLSDRGDHNGLSAVGHLKPGVTAAGAQADLDDVAAALRREHPESNADVTASVVPVTERLANGVGPVVGTLFGAVAILLLLAAVNVASLAVARSVSRRQEMALRAALGCGRRRLVRYLLAENLIVALAGGLGGLAIASGLLRVLIAAAPPGIPRLDEVGLDAGTWLFAVSVSAGIACLIAVLPGVQASNARDQQSLIRASRDDLGAAAGHRTRRGLMIVEIALAVILLTGAGLMARTLRALATVDPGFDPSHLLTLRFSIDGETTTQAQADAFDARLRAFYDRLLPSIQALPGVVAAGAAPSLPIDGAQWSSVFIVGGQPVPERALLPSSAFVPTTEDLFRTLGIHLRTGRFFGPADNSGAEPVAVVNQEFVHEFLRGVAPVGQRFKQGWPETPGKWIEIVGVVNDVKLNGLEQDTPPVVYLPMAQHPSPFAALVVRSIDEPAALLPAVRSLFMRLDPNLPLFDIHTMDDLVNIDLARQHLTLLILGGFATLAIVLACVGLFGVVAHGVSARTREIGVRLALGAKPGEVVALFVRQGVVTTVVGLAIGATAGFAMARFVEAQGLLFHVTARDPIAFLSAILVLLCVSAAACYLPARRASRVDPAVTLRSA